MGLLTLGIAAGLLNVALFQGISERYQTDAAGTVSRGGIWYGLGCLAVTLLVAGTFYAYSVPTILITMAAAPAIFGWIYARTWYAPAPEGAHPTLRQAIADFRSPGAVLFADTAVRAVRQRMVSGGMAAAISNPARRLKPQWSADHSGALIGFS